MSRLSEFTENDLYLVREKIESKYNSALIAGIVCIIPISLIGPYIPGKRSRRKLIDEMDYSDAILFIAIFWIITMLILAIWNRFKVNKEYDNLLANLEKEKLVTHIKSKRKSIFKNFDNIIITDLDDDLRQVKVAKIESLNMNIGDKIEIETELNTRTILGIKKL